MHPMVVDDLSVSPIPVEHHYANAMFHIPLDLPVHHLRTGLVVPAEKRSPFWADARNLVPRFTLAPAGIVAGGDLVVRLDGPRLRHIVRLCCPWRHRHGYRHFDPPRRYADRAKRKRHRETSCGRSAQRRPKRNRAVALKHTLLLWTLQQFNARRHWQRRQSDILRRRGASVPDAYAQFHGFADARKSVRLGAHDGERRRDRPVAEGYFSERHDASIVPFRRQAYLQTLQGTSIGVAERTDGILVPFAIGSPQETGGLRARMLSHADVERLRQTFW